MTTIVYRDGVFAWDTQTTWHGRAMTGGDKVFKNGPLIFGVAGLSRTSDILKYMEVPALREFEPDFDTERWVTNTLAPEILRAMKEVDAAEILNAQAGTESSVILHVNGVTGYLASNLSFVKDETGLYGVGSGSPYALGALKAGATPIEAVRIAIDLDLYSGGHPNTATIEELMA